MFIIIECWCEFNVTGLINSKYEFSNRFDILNLKILKIKQSVSFFPFGTFYLSFFYVFALSLWSKQCMSIESSTHVTIISHRNKIFYIFMCTSLFIISFYNLWCIVLVIHRPTIPLHISYLSYNDLHLVIEYFH